MFFSTLSDEKIHGVTINNDFRQFGIIKDPTQFGNRNTFSNTTGTPTFSVVYTEGGTPGLSVDQVLTLKNSSPAREFVVVETTSNATSNSAILTNLNNHSLVVGDNLIANTSEIEILGITGQPDINKFSGDLLFIDNRTAVTFIDEQLVTFRTILRL